MSDVSVSLLNRAEKIIPGGVNSPVRAFGNVGGTPRFFQRGSGPYLFDVDGKRYTDYVGSWGPLILGHNHPPVIEAIQNAVSQGLSFGAPTEVEVEIAELISQLIPSMEMLRMVSSGTEATLSAIRLARGFTSKNKIIKFDGCYHGHSDSLLVKAGSGALTLGIPGSAGVPKDLAQHTLVVPYNDLEATEKLFEAHSSDIAAIIVEPVAANMNLVLPKPGFLPGLRALCDKYNTVLIFDEVITGFRVALGGAQALYNVTPDITCLGKIVGGGLPVGAFGGKKEILSKLAPLGPVYQAGTLSGNPIAMTAGLATLKELTKPGVYEHLTQASDFLMQGISKAATTHGHDVHVRHIGGVFGFSFINDPEHNKFKNFFHEMLNQGEYFAPSPYESGFVSLAHDGKVLSQTVASVNQVFSTL